jgi:hypothetical protein
MERIRLDEHAHQDQLAEQLSEHRPLVVFAGGVACLADRHAQCSRVQRDLGDERRTAACCGLDGSPQNLAVTHLLIEIRCTTMDLGDRPVTDRSAQCCRIHLQEEVAERGIRWRPAQLQAECLGQGAVVADAELLQIAGF